MLEAIFTDAILSITLTGLFQWDYGQKLYIKGVNLQEISQVHFSNSKEKEAIVMPAVKQGDYVVCDIPNVLLEKSLDITAWVYDIGENSGETVRTIILKVEPRTKPQDFISQNPDAEDILAGMIADINGMIADNAEFKQDITNKYNQNVVDNTQFKNEVTTEVNDFTTNMTEEFDTVKADFNDILKVCNWNVDNLTVYGRTVQNCLDHSSADKFSHLYGTIEDGYITLTGKGDWVPAFTKLTSAVLKPSTIYTFIVDVKENSLVTTGNALNFADISSSLPSAFKNIKIMPSLPIGVTKFTMETIDDLSLAKLADRLVLRNEVSSGTIKLRYAIVEGDWTNRDIGFVPFGLNGIQVSEIGVRGKNLFDVSKIPTTWNGVSGIKNNGDGTIYLKNTSSSSAVPTKMKLKDLCPWLEVGKKYLLSYENSKYQDNKEFYLSETKKHWYVGIQLQMTSEYLESIVYMYPSLSVDTEATLSNFQIEEAEVATEYEPYMDKTVQLAEPVTLHGIPVSSGGNVTIDGQQYISDTIEIQDGVIGVCRRTKEAVFDGSSDEGWKIDGNSNYYHIQPSDLKEKGKLLCDKAYYNNGLPNSTNQCYTTTVIVIGCDRTVYPTVTEWKAYLAENNYRVIYELATPTFEPLNQLNQAEIKALTVKSMYHELITKEPTKTEATWKVFVQSEDKQETNVSIDLYVNATTGSDDNDGSQSSPFKTIQRAVEALKPSICGICNIYLYNGTYTGFEMANIEYDGSEHLKSAGIVIKAVDGQESVEINTDTLIDIEIPLLRNVSFEKITFLKAKDGSGGIRLWKGYFIFRNCNFHEYLTLNNASVSFESCVFNDDMAFSVTSDQPVQINKVRYYQCSGTLYLLSGKGTLLLNYDASNTINFLGDPLGTESKCYADIIQVTAGENWQP